MKINVHELQYEDIKGEYKEHLGDSEWSCRKVAGHLWKSICNLSRWLQECEPHCEAYRETDRHLTYLEEYMTALIESCDKAGIDCGYYVDYDNDFKHGVIGIFPKDYTVQECAAMPVGGV